METNMTMKGMHFSAMLQDSFAQLWIRARHLAFVLEYFSKVTPPEKSSPFGSHRVKKIKNVSG
jgi:hypothetical protein